MGNTAQHRGLSASARREPLLAGAILALYLVLGVVYSVVNPLFESPDELTHYPYIAQLAAGGGLPVVHADAPGLWAQEGTQPPLYYALGAALTTWIDGSDLAQVLVPNPHARVGEPGATDNLNAALHGGERTWPWRGTTLAVHLVRLLSVLMGAGTVWCTWRLARAALPRRPLVALGAMALNAFLPMFLFLSASVNNDNLATLLASLAMVLVVRVARGEARASAPLLLGLFIGLAGLAKLTGLGLLAPALGALIVREWRRPGGGSVRARVWRVLRDGALLGAVVLAVAGWWYARNWRLYGDPLGTAAMVQIMGQRVALPSWSEALGEFRGLRMSYWGLFGWFNVLLQPRWLYLVFDAIAVASLGGLGVGLVRAWRRRGAHADARPWAPLTLLALWVAVVALALVRWTLTTPASQGRLLFPAIGALSVLMALGLASLHRRAGRLVLGAAAVVLLLTALAAPFSSIRPAYAAPVLASLEALPVDARPYDVTYGDVARLVGYAVEPTSVAPDEALTVRLYWLPLARTTQDYSVYVHLFGLGGQPLGQRDTYPGGGACPTSRWSPGQVVVDRLQVPVNAAADGPAAVRVVVGLYDLATLQALPAADGAGDAVGEVTLTRVRLAHGGRIHVPAMRLDAVLGGRVRLAGYDLPDAAVAPGEVLPLVLYWEVLSPLEMDYTVLVHLLDAEGQIAGQGDGPPLANEYPTSLWSPGETLADPHAVALEVDLSPGDYRLVVGLYDPVTWARLPLLDEQGAASGDTVDLGRVRVERR